MREGGDGAAGSRGDNSVGWTRRDAGWQTEAGTASGDAIVSRRSRRLEALVERALVAGFPALYFPPLLEVRFERDTGGERTRHLVTSWLMAIVVYNGFLLLDWIVLRDVFEYAVLVRTGIMTPLSLVLLWFTHTSRDARRREALMTVMVVGVFWSVLFLGSLTSDPRAVLHATGIFLVATFANIVIRLRFWFAVAATIAGVLLTVSAGPLPHPLGVDAWHTVLIVLVATGTFTLFANYTLEREQRLNYLLGLRETFRQAQLAADNTRLALLTQVDALTGIANRRAADEYLSELCATGERAGVIMLDIDFFKLYNDHYGHVAGDECIRRVASVLRAALRRPEDMVARYGGEEFIVILLDAYLDDAVRAAERMRDAVHGLAIPHHASPVAPCVTISAGVAATEVATTPAAIVAAADTALYGAKAAGRNRVEPSLSGQPFG